MMRVGIVGSRDYDDEARVRAFVAGLPLLLGGNPFTVVSGGAYRRTKEWLLRHPDAPELGGVDYWAEDTARNCGYPLDVMNASWEMYGKSAGMIRNILLVESCHKVYIFWDGESRGSRHVIRTCKKKGVDYEVFGS